jgi:hypothetical protein
MIQDNNQGLPHRDDMDMDMVAKLQKMFPDKKIVFLGDLPDEEVTEEHLDIIKEIEVFHDYSLKNGLCVDCGERMPGFKPEDDRQPPAKGWFYLTKMNSDIPVAWICSSCNEVDEDA